MKDIKIFENRIQSIKNSIGSCNANDNLSATLSQSEITSIQEELEELFEKMLKILLIDSSDSNVVDTPKRLAKMYVQEVLQGRYQKKPDLTIFPNTMQVDELFTVGPINIRSCCSHHFVPFIGKIWIGVIPNENLLGLSKFARLAEWVMSRPQIQEEAIQLLADEIAKKIKPKGLAIVMKAKHFCMCWRGVKDNDCEMVTSVVRGLLKNQEARSEFFNLINL